MDTFFVLYDVRFEWDADKALMNLRKHGVSFELACEVFFDPFFLIVKEDIIEGEVRNAIVGLTTSWQLLYVVYVTRNDAIRIISARRTTRKEQLEYENQ
ncbi:MAG: BrnT family toxin [Chloroflexi bacterium]|nr:BrnT family toxin [Chloroflexota bacterium]